MDSGGQRSEIPKCIENNLGARLAVGSNVALQCDHSPLNQINGAEKSVDEEAVTIVVCRQPPASPILWRSTSCKARISELKRSHGPDPNFQWSHRREGSPVAVLGQMRNRQFRVLDAVS